MADGNWTTLIIAGEAMLVSLVVAIAMFIFLRRERRYQARLKNEVGQLLRRQAAVYLDREISNTLELDQRTASDDQAMKLFFRARLSWLQLEQEVLQEEGGRRSDPVLIQQAARSLIGILKFPESTKPSTLQVGQRSSESFKQVIALQKEIISRLKVKLAAVEKASKNVFDEVTLKGVGENVDVQLESVARLERELEAANARYRQVSEELAGLRAGYGSKPSDSNLMGADCVSTIHGYEKIPRAELASARGLVEAMEASHTESLNELRRMREANSRQRAMIIELEAQLSRVQSSAEDAESSQVLLDNLKQQLRDYENCTACLEMETEDLRTRIATLNRVMDVAEAGIADAGGENLPHDAESFSAIKLRSKLYAVAFRRLADIATQRSAEDAIELLKSGFGDPRLVFLLFIKGVKKEYWLSSQGESIDEAGRKILRAVVPSTDAPWIKVDGGAVYAGVSLKLFIRAGSVLDSVLERTCQFLTPQLQVIETLIRYLDLKPEIQMHSSLDDELDGKLAAIAFQHEQLCRESERLGADLQNELQTYIQSANFTAIQTEVLTSMLDDFCSDLLLFSKKAEAINSGIKDARETR